MSLNIKNHALSKMDAATIVVSIFASWFLGSYLTQHDWARALGSAIWSFLLGFGVVGTINRRGARRIREALQEEVNHSLGLSNDPETPWVKILVKARAQMPPEDYEKFERAVLKLVGDINAVNRSGLATQSEKMALLEKLTKSSAPSND